MEMTIEQKRAVAMANARLRVQGQPQQKPAKPVREIIATTPEGAAFEAMMYGQGTDPAAAAVRYGVPMLQPEGGPGGAAAGWLGEAGAQFIEGTNDSGARVASATMNSIPGAAVAAPFRALKNVARMTGGAIAAEEARSLINERKLVDPTQTASIVAGTTAAAPILGRVAGKIMGKTDAADAAAKAIEQSRNQTRDASIKAGQDIGLAVPPTTVNDSWLNRRLEGFAGPDRVARQAGVNNNVAGGDALRVDVGMEAGDTLDFAVIKAAKKTAAQPYRDIAGMSENGGITMYYDGTPGSGFLTTDASAVKAGANQSAKVNAKNPLVIDGEKLKTLEDRQILDPDWKEKAFARGHDAVIIDNGTGRVDAFIPQDYDPKAILFKGTPIETAAKDLEEMKLAGKEATKHFNKFSSAYDPIAGQRAKDRAKALDERIRTAALQTGDKTLMNRFLAGRQQWAKLDAIEKALNTDSGEIDLNKIGALSARGKPLSGAMDVVGGFANATKGKFTRPTASMPNPGSSGLDGPTQMAALLAGGIKGLVISTANLARDPVRNAMLSKWGQKTLAQPNYVPRTVADQQVTDITRRIASNVAIAMGSRVNPEKKPAAPTDGFLPEGQPVTTPQPASGQTTYTDEHGNTYPIRDVPGMGRGVVIENKFYPVID